MGIRERGHPLIHFLLETDAEPRDLLVLSWTSHTVIPSYQVGVIYTI